MSARYLFTHRIRERAMNLNTKSMSSRRLVVVSKKE
jgi:hypothetical protein